MVRNFFRTVALILAINLVVKVSWVLGIELLVQNALGLKVYGTYYTLLNLSFLLSFFLDFGLARYNATHTALENASTPERSQFIIRWKLFLSSAYLVGTVLLGFSLGYNRNQILVLVIASFSQVLASYILYFRSVFTGLRNFLLEGIGSVLDRGIMIVLCLVVLLGPLRHSLNLTNYFIIQFLGYLMAFAIMALAWRRQPHATAPTGAALEWRQLAAMTLPFAVLVGLESINDKMPIVLLERLHASGPEEAGKFAFGLRWLEAYRMFASLIGVLLIPYYAQVLHDKAKIQSMLSSVLTVTLGGTITGVVILCVFAPEVVGLLTAAPDASLTYVFILNAITFLPYPIIFVMQPLLTVLLRLRSLGWLWSTAIILNLAGGVTLLYPFGAVGIASVFAASMILLALLQTIAVVRAIPELHVGRLFVQSSLYGVLFLVAVYFSRMFLPAWPALAVSLVAAATLLMGLKLIVPSDVREMFRQVIRRDS